MRVLVAGGGGQVGREMARLGRQAGPSIDLVAMGSDALDITDEQLVHATVAEFAPDVIVNAAAYTAVDQAEAEEDQAVLVNGTAVGYLADGANRVGAMLVHVSTDYVFDGTAPGWYSESDPTGPVSAYGRSKLLGEEMAHKADRSVVLRTAWLYSAVGKNFVSTILRLLPDRTELSVVGDQVGCPTSARDLAVAIMELIRWVDDQGRVPPSRTYHLVSPDEATWHDVALAVIAASSSDFDGPCHRITTDEYPTPARRPANSRLSTKLIADELGIVLPSWRQSLPSVVAELEQ